MVKIEMSEAEVKEPSDSESQLNSPLEKFRSSASTKDAETGYFSTDELSARIRNELDPDNQRSSRASNYLVSPVVSGKEAPESCDGNVDNNGENDEADEEKEKNENEPEVRPGSVQSVPEESSEYLRSILDNFNSLYMEKLKMLDDLVEKGDEDQKLHLMEKKADMLENWAKDVCVHNLVLVHTVEELEKEANRKVVALQKKIMESTQVAKEHMTMIKKYEQQVKLLLKNHSEAEEKNLVLQIELKKLKSECKRVRDRMNSLLNDHENLITLVCRIRDMGVWDVDGLELQRSSFDQIFGLYPSLVGQEVQSVFTTEKAKCAQQAEEKLERLQKKLDDLKETTKDADSFIVLKDRKIEELETEITNLSNKVHYCEEECNDYKKSLLETQEKLLKATKELTRQSRAEKSESRSEMSELLRELRVVKSQLNTAVEEKQNAREETNYFKKELSDRLKEVQDIQHFMQSLATEVVSSRQALQQVQEKEVQLQTLKTEVQTYQTRCADADDTIRKKEKEIVKLQKQMNEIHQRTKRPSTMTSTPPEESEEKPKNKSNVTSFYKVNLRNVTSPSPSKIPVRRASDREMTPRWRKAPNSNKKSSIVSQKPAWNTNFRRSRSDRDRDGEQDRSKSTGGSRQISMTDLRRKMDIVEAQCEALAADEPEIHDLEWGDDERSQQLHEIYKNLMALIEEDNKCVMSRTYRRANAEKFAKQKQEVLNQLSKLPMVTETPKEKMVESQSRGQGKGQSSNKNADKGGSGDATERLPLIKLKPLETRSQDSLTKELSRPPKRLENPVLKNLMKNPISRSPRVNELISAVVQASKQLLGSGSGSEAEDEGGRKTKLSSRIQTVEITGARISNKDGKGKKNVLSVSRIQSLDREKGKFAEDQSKTKQDSPPAKTPNSSSPRNVGEFLKRLPRDSQENLVKSWIRSQSQESFEEKGVSWKDEIDDKSDIEGDNDNENEDGNVKVIFNESHGHDTWKVTVSDGNCPLGMEAKRLANVSKHLASKRFPTDMQNRAKSKCKSDVNDITKQMFDLDDEWEKVIGSMGSKSAGSGPTGRDNKIDKSSVLDENQSQNQTEIFFSDETQRDPDSTTPRTMEFLTRQHHQEPPFPSVSPDTPRSLNSSTATTATEPPSKPDSLLLQQLLEALALEKRQMEEHFQKVLLDKDIELKMQKVTIQHLQDAYVALKRGQPIPVPQNVTGNKIVPISNVATPPAANGQGLHNHNNNNNNNHKKHHNQVLDV